MANVLRLADAPQAVTVNLLSGTLRLKPHSWTTRSAPMEGSYAHVPYGAQALFAHYGLVVEQLDLVGNDTRANLVAAQNDIAEMLEGARLFHKGELSEQSRWLEWNVDGESAKRALVFEGSLQVLSAVGYSAMMDRAGMLARLSLTRHPLWENVATTYLSAPLLSTLGGKYNYSSVPGNAPARLDTTTIWASSLTGMNLYRVWAGIRRLNQGVTNFNPVWECEDGTNDAAVDTSDTVDATASGGDRVTVTFATVPTLARRMTITVNQVAAAYGHGDEKHFQGRYLVLCRCKVTAGTAGIQLRWGYTGNNQCEEVYVDHTSWRLIPLGNISIPPYSGADYGDDVFTGFFRLDLYAEEVNTCDLYLDCFVLIPNEHLLTLEGTTMTSVDVGIRYAEARVHENDVGVAYEHVATVALYDALDFGMVDWYLPPGSGCIVVAGENQASHDLSETISLTMDYVPRWLLHRES